MDDADAHVPTSSGGRSSGGQSSDSYEVVVEIPQGTRNKYEYDHDTGEIWLDRHLFAATVYPAEYGFFPHTLAEDGDPLDALVLLEDPTFPGCHMHARPVAVLEMTDEHGRDLKVLCVPAGDPRWAAIEDVADVPDYLLAEIRHFFSVYKDLEPGKDSMLGDWSGRHEAHAAIADASERYHRE
jgi:inorganic pyrophosphatase